MTVEHAPYRNPCPACGHRGSIATWVMGRVDRERWLRCLGCGDHRPASERGYGEVPQGATTDEPKGR